MDLKEAKISQKINQLQYKKKQGKLQHEYSNVEHQKRKQKNKLEVELNRETKINNYLLTEAEKQEKVAKALLEKKNMIENQKREKEAYFQEKVNYAKQLEEQTISQKRNKVEQKFSELDKRHEDRAMQEIMYRKNL